MKMARNLILIWYHVKKLVVLTTHVIKGIPVTKSYMNILTYTNNMYSRAVGRRQPICNFVTTVVKPKEKECTVKHFGLCYIWLFD